MITSIEMLHEKTNTITAKLFKHDQKKEPKFNSTLVSYPHAYKNIT